MGTQNDTNGRPIVTNEESEPGKRSCMIEDCRKTKTESKLFKMTSSGIGVPTMLEKTITMDFT